MFLGARLGELFYYFDLKHKAIAYANIKTAFGAKLSPQKLSNLTKQFYRSFGQNLIEILLIPLADKAYIDKYITLQGKENISAGFKKGKGVIFLAVHAGSWEFSNIICANLGFAFNLFIRGQRYPRLNGLLNSYRAQKGCKLIQRNQARELIRALETNQAIGMTADQGGKSGTPVKFFGKYTSMPSGAIRLALKYDAALIPVFYTRINGPYIKAFIEPPLEIKKTANLEQDINDNLQALVRVFEKYILSYPQEYLWSYKIWKYTKEQNILIVSDGKAGHLRQSEAVAGLLKDCLKDKGISADINTIEVKFRNKLSRHALTASSLLAGKYRCQGCLWCLRTFLEEDIYKTLIGIKPDIVISCGASVAPVNYVISRENLAKSIVIMRPSILSTRRFDLVVMSRHDNPPKMRNVIVTEGALNLISETYLREQSQKLMQLLAISYQPSAAYIGLLIGGDSKNFCLKEEMILEITKQIKLASQRLEADILLTTSRRTSLDIEKLLKKEFKDYPRCKLLIIANEKNIPQAVGGILALSKVIIASPESISMISEAVNSRKYVLVFNAPNLDKKHRRFLNYFAKNKYIYLVDPCDLAGKIEEVWLSRPQMPTLGDNLLVTEAIKKIL
jgi:KDO2-lipid IV(A) lauroyltransferase